MKMIIQKECDALWMQLLKNPDGDNIQWRGSVQAYQDCKLAYIN